MPRKQNNHNITPAYAFCWLSAILYPGFAFLMFAFIPGVYNDVLGRSVVGLFCLVLVLLYHAVPATRPRFDVICYMTFHAVAVHFFYLIYRSNIVPVYMMGSLVLVSCYNASFLKRLPLISYSLLVIILSVLVSLFAHAPATNKFMLIAGVAFLQVVNYVSCSLRIAAIEAKDQMQQQVIQSAKLASLGTLSSGIAHELNNPLAAIIGYSEAMIHLSGNSFKVPDAAEHIHRNAVRMKEIIDHLRIFSRRTQHQDWCAITIDEPIRNSLVLLKNQLMFKNIELDLSLDPGVPMIWGSAVQLESIFQNLLTNSIDAFDDVKDLRKKRVLIKTAITASQSVEILYEDNAAGMSEQTRQKMFEPFFTTKAVGKGTGLGMSVSLGIIENHRGTIEVESKLDVGTTFRLVFPSITAESQAKSKAAERSVPDYGILAERTALKPTVLIIDDDEAILELLATFLGRIFEVRSISSPSEAISVVTDESFSLILTDIRMPKISGLQIIEAAKKFQPDTPVVIMSGNDEYDEEVQRAIDLGAAHFVRKPFESLALLAEQLLKMSQGKGMNRDKKGTGASNNPVIKQERSETWDIAP